MTRKTNLMAVHNLSARKLKFANEIGGLACPSVAIVRSDFGFHDFEEISLIAHSELINPAKVPAYNSDIHSATFPSLFYDVNKDAISKLKSFVEPVCNEINDNFDLFSFVNRIEKGGVGDAVFNMINDPVFKISFLREKGGVGKLPMKGPNVNHDVVTSVKVKNWLKKHGEIDYFDNKNQKLLVDLGNRVIEQVKKDQEKMRLELSQIMDSPVQARMMVEWEMEKMMKSFRDSPKGPIPSFHLFNELISDYERIIKGKKSLDKDKFNEKTARIFERHKDEFKSWCFDLLDDVIDNTYFYHETPSGNRVKKKMTLETAVRSMKGQLVDSEGFSFGLRNVRALLSKRFDSIASIKQCVDLLKTPEDEERALKQLGENLSVVASVLEPYYRGNADSLGYRDRLLEDVIQLSMHGSSNYFESIGESELKEVRELLTCIKESPRSYFEAKLQRAVSLDEFSGAVIPVSAPSSVFSILEDAGIRYETYKHGCKKSRNRALLKFKELGFNEHLIEAEREPVVHDENVEIDGLTI